MKIDQKLLVNYLLKRLDPESQEELEKQFFNDDTLFDQLLTAEDELIESYQSGQLSREEKFLFEQRYLSSVYRRQKVDFYASLPNVIAEIDEKSHTFKKLFDVAYDALRWFIQQLRLPPVRRVVFASALVTVLTLILRPLLFTPTLQQPTIIQSDLPTGNNQKLLNVDLQFLYETGNTLATEEVPLRLRGTDSILKLPQIQNRTSSHKPPNAQSGQLVLTEDDRYSIQVHPESGIYLYVIQWDTNGNTAVLFPNPALTAFSNPLDSGRSYRIPSAPQWCTLDPNPGIEMIAFGASTEVWKSMEGNIKLFENGDKIQKQTAADAMKQSIIEVEKNPHPGFYGKRFSFIHEARTSHSRGN
jgi:hypothetical protein